MRRGAALATAILASLILAPAALASVFHGSGRDDPEMSVKLTLKAEELRFEYSGILMHCPDGEQLRQGLVSQLGTVAADGRFRDVYETSENVGTTRSLVRGRVLAERARGVIVYDLDYAGGACHSGKVRWRAKRG